MSMKINCIGVARLATDVTAKQAGNALLANFNILFFGSGNSKTAPAGFITCVAWRKVAEHCQKYLSKGSEVVITGILEEQRWQDKNGQNRSKHVIVVNDVQFVKTMQTEDNGNSNNDETMSVPPPSDDVPEF